MESVICFAYPKSTKSISVTEGHCEQDCAHCGGHYLKHMLPISAIEESNAASFLISGGCRDGTVPISQHIAELKALKQGRRYNLHVGLVNEAEIAEIAEIADCISFDFVGDDETIREVFGIQRTVSDYVHCYTELRQQVKVMPHICIGLHGGEIRGEYRAVELLRELGMDGLTFIIFTPTRGTRYADCLPPNMEEVVTLLKWARQACPLVPIHLGCMRPGGRYRSEIDQWAVKIGIDTIVNPTPKAVALAKELGMSILRKEECCVL
ncbi:MAG: radical SAM protein [Sporomusaceae bacterium]|nr:radical SAM protein [Sporomusaceae bacterium]